MGSTEEDVMGDWNNSPKRATVSSFYMDRTGGNEFALDRIHELDETGVLQILPTCI